MFSKILPRIRPRLNAKCDQLVRGYFDQVLRGRDSSSFGRSTQRSTIVVGLVLLLLYAVNPILLTILGQTSNATRLALYDIMLFLVLPQRLNWITVLFTVNTVYFQYALHFCPVRKVIAFIEGIRYHQRSEYGGKRFFFQSKVRAQKRAKNGDGDKVCYCSVAEVIRQRTDRHLWVAHYLGYLMVQCVVFYHLSSVYHLVKYHWKDLWSTNSTNPLMRLFALLTVHLTNGLLFDHMMLTFARLLIIWTVMVISMTIAFRLKFDQLDRYVNKRTMIRFTRAFQRVHTETLVVLTTEHNRLFGGLLLWLILCHCPQNSYLLMALWLGRFRGAPAQCFILANYLLAQWIFILLFHLLAGWHSTRLHRPVQRLGPAALSVKLKTSQKAFNNDNNNNKPNTRANFRLALYVERYRTARAYGITYGPFGLMSIRSFCRFLVFYGEFMLYWYRLVQAP